MATYKQIKANQQNALKSTGPKSTIGKMISSRNSINHGFYASCAVLPTENRDEYLRFARRLVMAHSPCGVLEEDQVKTIIDTNWQLRRAVRVDSELFQMYQFYEGEQRGVGTAFAQDAAQANAFSKLIRYLSFLQRRVELAVKELTRLKAVRALAGPTLTSGETDGFTNPQAPPTKSRPESLQSEQISPRDGGHAKLGPNNVDN